MTLPRTIGRLLPAALSLAHPACALAQTSFIAPDGRNRFPAVTIFCPSGTGVTPCNFGSGSGGGAVSLTLGGAPVSAGNRMPTSDALLDGLIGGGALAVSGTVLLGGSPVVTLGAGANGIGSVTVSNLPATQAVSGAVSQAGSWTTALAGGSTVGLSAGSNPIGSVTVTNLPATQAISGSVGQAGSWTTALAGGSTVGLSAGTNAIGSVAVSNYPATQPISAASLPLPAGAASSAAQTAPLGPVAPGAASATNAMVIGCLANTTPPGFANGQQGAIACDTFGRPYVVTVPSANNVPGYLQAVASGGAVTFRAINAAASSMAAGVKSSGGMVYGYEACNSGASAAYLRLFAQATAPTVGTSTPAVSKLLAAGSCQTASIPVGLVFGTGIALDVTSGSMADNDTTVIAAANQISVEIYYK